MVKKIQTPPPPFLKRASAYPEVNLFVGILREAWVDALLPPQSNFYRERERRDAQKFMEGSEKAWDESFEIICGLLNIESAELRKAYFSFKKYYARDQQFKPEDAFNTFIWELLND